MSAAGRVTRMESGLNLEPIESVLHHALVEGTGVVGSRKSVKDGGTNDRIVVTTFPMSEGTVPAERTNRLFVHFNGSMFHPVLGSVII